MSTPPRRPRRQKPQPAMQPLRHVGITLSAREAQILTELAAAQSDLTGRTVSGSAVVRALIRAAKRKIEALELRDELEREIGGGRRWGVDNLGKLQGRGRPRHHPGSALTLREFQVLHLLVAGESNKTIAATLAQAEGTVKLHLQNLREKLGAKSRLEAVTIALKRGLLPVSGSEE